MNLDKTILISGTSKNLGKFLAEYYLNEKFNVVGISRSKVKNSKYNIYKCDLSNAKMTNVIFKKIKTKYKKIDYIISCAGFSKKSYKEEENLKDWNLAFNNNFFCFTNLLTSYLKHYKKKPTKIVVISSIASKKITKAPITYSVAKSALNFYSQFKAKQLAKHKININILLPGNILMKNNNWDKKIKKNKRDIKKYIKDNVPLNNFCNPNQIIELCNYLFGKSGDYITGSKFIIDAGETL
tara:strand:- start:4673 stop:5392 length:720 start_codon:yes stop_codon:yes gene_type:complete